MIYNRKTVSTITAPAGLAVSLAEIKEYLVITGTADDNLLTDLIEAATEAVKRYTRSGVQTETVELQMDGFPGYQAAWFDRLGAGIYDVYLPRISNSGAEFDLPYAPIASVTSITTYDASNAATELDSAAYGVDQQGGRVYLNDGYTWPQNLRQRDAVRVRYVIGSETIPAPILTAIKQHVSAMYECRSACELPSGCKAILEGYRRFDDLGFA